MFRSPYDTSIGKVFNLPRVEHALHMANIKKELKTIYPDMPWLLAVVGDEPTEIPVFPHPVTLEDSVRGKQVVVDLRGPYKRYLTITDTGINVDPYGGAGITVNRAILQYYWSADTADAFFALSDVPLIAFSRWLADQISRALGLDPAAQLALPVVLAYYFTSLYMEKPIAEEEATRIANKISRVLRINLQQVLDSIPNPIPSNLRELVAVLGSGDYGPKLERLNNVGLFYSMTTNGFFGVMNPKEVLACAIEYPPTFLAILAGALNDTSFNKIPLITSIKHYVKQDAVKGFNLAFNQFLARGDN